MPRTLPSAQRDLNLRRSFLNRTAKDLFAGAKAVSNSSVGDVELGAGRSPGPRRIAAPACPIGDPPNINHLVPYTRHAAARPELTDPCDAEVHGELLMLAVTVLAAGTDTTRNQLAAAVQVLCEHPDQWALLAAHPALAPNAVHEVMRYCPIIFGTIRRAADD
jgi:hypothetical protein